MKVGIYIDGLGQSVAQESAVKYTERLKNEYRFHKTGVSYNTKAEKIKYANNCESNVVSIIENDNGTEKIVYKIYDFQYGDILTSEFNKRNILIKNLTLLALVLKKFPMLLKRIFIRNGYYRPFQTFYIFFIFTVIAGGILLLIPSCIAVILSVFAQPSVVTFVHSHPWINDFSHYLNIDSNELKHISAVFITFISLVMLVAPQINFIITSLATEFVCAHLYLEFGKKKQDILGNLDQLCEYIIEHEKDAKIHFHAYSFGTLVAIDYLFTFAKNPSGNMVENSEALITIGTPFDLVHSYYPRYYQQRSNTIESKIKWLNVYSIADGLASNFRRDTNIGDAEYGVIKDGLKPININYEVVHLNKYNFINFITLMSVKIHAMYWSSSENGQSCSSSLYDEMRKQNLM